MDLSMLEEIGLSQREARTYLALLDVGLTTVGPLVRRSNVPSSKIYEILDRLMEKGLVSYVTIKNQKNFQASDPQRILDYLDEKRKRIEEIMPELRLKQHFSTQRQNVELFEGRKAIFSLLNSLVDKARPGDEYLSFAVGTDHEHPEISRFYTQFTWRRVQNKLKTRVLANNHARKIQRKIYPLKIFEAIQMRYTSFTFPQGFVVIGDKLVILDWKDPATAIMITSKNITAQYKEFFYELYNSAKKA